MSYYEKNAKRYYYVEYCEIGPYDAHSSMYGRTYRYLAFPTTWARLCWLAETNRDSWGKPVARKITRRQLEKTIGTAYIIVGAGKWRHLDGAGAPYEVISRDGADRLGVPFAIYEYQSRPKNY